MGPNRPAVESVDGHMGEFMAEDFLQEIFVNLLQVGCQTNPTLGGPT